MPSVSSFKNLFLMALTGAFCSCGFVYDSFHLSESGVSNNSQSSPETSITYAEVNAQIFTPICIQCHSVAGGNRGGINLETYQTVLPNLSAVQNAVLTNFMPLNGPPLSDDLKTLLNTWIANGAPQSAEEIKLLEEAYSQTE